MKKDDIQSGLLALFTMSAALAVINAGAIFNLIAFMTGLAFGIWLLLDQYIF